MCWGGLRVCGSGLRNVKTSGNLKSSPLAVKGGKATFAVSPNNRFGKRLRHVFRSEQISRTIPHESTREILSEIRFIFCGRKPSNLIITNLGMCISALGLQGPPILRNP